MNGLPVTCIETFMYEYRDYGFGWIYAWFGREELNVWKNGWIDEKEVTEVWCRSWMKSTVQMVNRRKDDNLLGELDEYLSWWMDDLSTLNKPI